MKDYFSYTTGKYDEPEYVTIIRDLLKECPGMDIAELVSYAMKWSRCRLNPASLIKELKKQMEEE